MVCNAKWLVKPKHRIGKSSISNLIFVLAVVVIQTPNFKSHMYVHMCSERLWSRKRKNCLKIAFSKYANNNIAFQKYIFSQPCKSFEWIYQNLPTEYGKFWNSLFSLSACCFEWQSTKYMQFPYHASNNFLVGMILLPFNCLSCKRRVPTVVPYASMQWIRFISKKITKPVQSVNIYSKFEFSILFDGYCVHVCYERWRLHIQCRISQFSFGFIVQYVLDYRLNSYLHITQIIHTF